LGLAQLLSASPKSDTKARHASKELGANFLFIRAIRVLCGLKIKLPGKY
jgi:hypothetical protein